MHASGFRVKKAGSNFINLIGFECQLDIGLQVDIQDVMVLIGRFG